jgi:copper chaperone CopZ
MVPALAVAADGDTTAVTVVGEGMSKDEAILDGKRKAVEQVFVKIYSSSEVKDFVLVKDTILTRAAGFVRKYDVVSTDQAEDGVVSVKMQVVVTTQPINDMWGVVTNLLKDVGRPKIMVFLAEKIDGTLQDSSTVQTRIEERLLASGFLLVDRAQIEAIDQKNLQAAIAEDNPAVVQAIARKFNAQIFVTGAVNATTGGVKSLYGRAMHVYEAEANLRVFRSDTAQLLSAQPGQATRGVKDVARSAAKQALDAQGQQLAPKITYDILRFWQEALGGRGEVQLKVEGVSFGDVIKIKNLLQTVKGVKDVTSNFHKPTVDFSIQADTNAQTLAERIAEALDGVIEIEDVSQNVIKAKYVKK